MFSQVRSPLLRKQTTLLMNATLSQAGDSPLKLRAQKSITSPIPQFQFEIKKVEILNHTKDIREVPVLQADPSRKQRDDRRHQRRKSEISRCNIEPPEEFFSRPDSRDGFRSQMTKKFFHSRVFSQNASQVGEP